MNTKILQLLNGKIPNHVMPFFWQHGEEESILRLYMRKIRSLNILSVCVESRPHPDFVGAGWWRDMDIILDEAKKLGMNVWILDDSHFPTGFANGALKNASPELCRQSLVRTVIPCNIVNGKFTCEISKNALLWQPNMFESFSLPKEHLRAFDDDVLISAIALKNNGADLDDVIDVTGFIKDGKIEFELPEGEWQLNLIYATRNRGPHRDYINMMSEKSCRILIDAVYEPHYKHYSELFGNTIAGFFSDEPELGNGHLYEYGKRLPEMEDQAWSEQIANILKECWGSDYNKYLPLLWEENFASELKAKVRCDYMQAVTRQVQKAFSEQIGGWCKSHNVKYIGHCIEDDNQHTRTGSGLGHYFRGLSGQDMAGIDDIGGQVIPQGETTAPHGLTGQIRNGLFYHYVLGKLGASCASIEPNKNGNCMCEIFGNYGWAEGVRLEKYLVDHFLVRGINYFVPHAFSPKEFPDPDCPPHFYARGNNPQFRHFGALMLYTNRVAELISGGKPKVTVAVLYNAESEWMGDCTNLEEVAKPLAENQIDYHFIPADVFTDKKYSTSVGKTLVVNGIEYDCFIIPKAQYVPSVAVDALEQISRNGGKAYFIDERPQGVYNGREIVALNSEVQVLKLSELVAALNCVCDVNICPSNKYIRCLHYMNESSVYLIVNEGTEIYKGRIQLKDGGNCYVYDAWNNRIEKAKYTKVADGTSVEISLSPLNSLIIVFDDAHSAVQIYEDEWSEADKISINGNWERSVCRSIDYPAFKSGKIVNLPDDTAIDYPTFSGFVRYKKSFKTEGTPAKALLEITDAYEGVELFINGKSMGIQVVPPYRFDISGQLRSGDNDIEIEVATTLERELSYLPDDTRTYLGLPPAQPENLSGLCGDVNLFIKKE